MSHQSEVKTEKKTRLKKNVELACEVADEASALICSWPRKKEDFNGNKRTASKSRGQIKTSNGAT